MRKFWTLSNLRKQTVFRVNCQLAYSDRGIEPYGKSIEHSLKIDGEIENIPVVKFNESNRSQFRLFFLEAVAEESDRLLAQLTESFDKNDYDEVTYRLRKLQELRKGIENPTHQFLQRV